VRRGACGVRPPCAALTDRAGLARCPIRTGQRLDEAVSDERLVDRNADDVVGVHSDCSIALIAWLTITTRLGEIKRSSGGKEVNRALVLVLEYLRNLSGRKSNRCEDSATPARAQRIHNCSPCM
jgi:hypothetical protein